MDIRQLRYFICIVESGSFSEASRKLHIVQPALSQRLADLEEELSAQLLVRGRTGVTMTDAGAELYQRARIIVKQMDAAKVAVQEKAGKACGGVSIGVLRSLVHVIGGALFMKVKQELPDIQLTVVEGYSDELMARLRATRLDLTMQVVSPHNKGMPSLPLFAERVCLVGTRSFMPARVKSIKLTHLEGLPMLLNARHPGHDLLLELAERSGVTLSMVGGIEDTSSVLDVCAASMAVTLLPESTARRAGVTHGLLRVPLDEPDMVRELVLVGNPDVPKTGAVAAVEAVFLQLVAEMLEGTGIRKL